MLQIRENPAIPLTSNAALSLSEGNWLWARLENEQLETWLGDYMWFVDFGEPEHRDNCARTCDELTAECALRGRHDLIRRAWARLASNIRGVQ
jgi:hypothetical protein